MSENIWKALVMDYYWIFSSQNHKQGKKRTKLVFLALYIWSHDHWWSLMDQDPHLYCWRFCIHAYIAFIWMKELSSNSLWRPWYKMEVYHKEISPKEFYISKSRRNKGSNKWINVHWSHGHHNKILWLFLSSSFVFLGCYYLWWTKEIKYFNGLFLLEWLWISCKMEAITRKKITWMGPHVFYIIINWGRATCTIQNLRDVVPFIISNKYSQIFTKG